uniref:4-hydroxyphenylpyruvate dioxygenase n=1 Tax=Bursaphelenchus xylophilus TaxID=6326 RepID=A0A1I7RV55_BURXY
MTTYEKGEKPANGQFHSFDHVRFYVGNAKQAAYWYCANFGFKPFAYKGLETGSRLVTAHAIKQDKIIFVFESALLPGNQEMGDHLVQHGDGVRDVAFSVDNVDWIVDYAKKQGAKVVQDVTEEKDENGSVKIARLQTVSNFFKAQCLCKVISVCREDNVDLSSLEIAYHRFESLG